MKTPEQKAIYKAKFWSNARKTWREASSWLVTIVTLAATYFLSLSREEQIALLESYPVLSKFLPTISMALWIYTKAHPQKTLNPDLENPPAESDETRG